VLCIVSTVEHLEDHHAPSQCALPSPAPAVMSARRGPVVLIFVLGCMDELVLVAYEDHDSLNAILVHTRAPLDFLLRFPFRVDNGVFLLKLRG
jgi:hypothetical protein